MSDGTSWRVAAIVMYGAATACGDHHAQRWLIAALTPCGACGGSTPQPGLCDRSAALWSAVMQAWAGYQERQARAAQLERAESCRGE